MSSSSTPTSNPGREQQMLAVGRQCSHPSCHLVDFLPFRCQHCADSFCADHFKPASHSCAKYDEAKYNRVAPDCPLCNEPVPIPPGEDPNIRMERHLTIDCSVMTGRSQKASATPKCARPKCGKLLFAQIQCDKCHQKFCPEHRFPSSHNCVSIASTALPPSTSAETKPSIPTPMISASGMAAMKRAAASVKSSVLSPSVKATSVPPSKGVAPSSGVVASGSKTRTNTSPPKPFSKTDRSSMLTMPGAILPVDETHTATDISGPHSPKLPPEPPIDAKTFIPRPRSKQEKDSQIRAMRARAQKGLLSEDEKVILASLEAERARGSGDKECAVM